MNKLVAFISGIIFAAGLAISGMTQPSKVIGFLDFFGPWDPSLAFVMGGAVLVNAILYRFIIKRDRPLLASEFKLPTRNDIEWRLVVGGALFGIGWGLAGYCPGPGITALSSFAAPAVTFVAAMAGGMLLYSLFEKRVLSKADS